MFEWFLWFLLLCADDIWIFYVSKHSAEFLRRPVLVAVCLRKNKLREEAFDAFPDVLVVLLGKV